MALDFTDDPYATHLRLLSELGCIRGGIKSVLELGAGLHSTPMFLNRQFYPHLTRLLTVEHNADWAARVSAATPDARKTMVVVSEPIETYLSTFSLDEFDLIFVDNSDHCDFRIKTIEYVGANVTSALVVMHDFQYEFYDAAAHAFSNRIIDTGKGLATLEGHNIHTALLWKGDTLNFRGEECRHKIY